MHKRSTAYIIWVLASVSIGLLVIGLWFSTDPDPTILGKYRLVTLAQLVAVSVVGYLCVLYLRFVMLPQHWGRGISHRPITLRTKARITLLLLVVGFIAAQGFAYWHERHTWARTRQLSAAGFDPFLQAVPAPNDREFRINRWGFRGRDIEREKPPNTYRIFVVGGSTVYCSRVSFEYTHARVLERQLTQRFPRINIEVQNAGMHWHTSQHSLMKILFKIQDFSPDMIIVYHAINDMYRSFSPNWLAVGPYRNDYSHYHGPIASMVREYFRKPVGPLSHVRQVFRLFRRRWFADFRGGASHEQVEMSVTEWPSLWAFERNMRNLARHVHSLDIDLVMASQPYLYRDDLTEEELGTLWFPNALFRSDDAQADLPSIISGMDQFNASSRLIAEVNDALFVDLEAEVPKNLIYFLDDVHYTEEGNRAIGESLADHIAGGGFIDGGFPEPHMKDSPENGIGMNTDKR